MADIAIIYWSKVQIILNSAGNTNICETNEEKRNYYFLKRPLPPLQAFFIQGQ
jgi:hypothetical protein